MRAANIMLAAGCCAAALTACSSGTSGAVTPSGWTASHGSAPVVWTSPQHPGQSYKATDAPANGTDLTALASTVTTNTLLQYRGARFLDAKRYPGCPGEAGLQRFTVPAAHGSKDLLQVAFTVWEGRQKIAYYERPARDKDAAEAVAAMQRTVCTAG